MQNNRNNESIENLKNGLEKAVKEKTEAEENMSFLSKEVDIGKEQAEKIPVHMTEMKTALDEKNSDFQELKEKRHHQKEDKSLKQVTVYICKNLNYKRLAALLTGIVLILGGLFGLHGFLNKNKNPQDYTAITTDVIGIQSGIMPGMSEQEIYDWNNKEKDNSLFEVNFNKNLIFKDTTSTGYLRLINPRYSVYPLSVDLVVRENHIDKIVYTSDILYPEQYLANIRLDLRMEKGVYEAYALFKYYDQMGNSELKRQKVNMSITIKK